MRSYNDAIRCSQEIAQKDTSVDHYKNYIKVLIGSLRDKSVLIDADNKVMASSNSPASATYSLLKFA